MNATYRRRLSRGTVEARGQHWWNRHRIEEVTQGGERRRRSIRLKLGTTTEIRTQAAAVAELERILGIERAEVLVPGERVHFADYAARWCAVHGVLMRPNSRKAYEGAIRRHLVPAHRGSWLDGVGTREAQQLIASMVEADYSRTTIKFIRAVLLQVLRQARADGFSACHIDPRLVKMPKVTRVQERRHITRQELERLIATSSWPARALWALMGFAGLRIGEALGMTWAAIDFQARLLAVRQAATSGAITPPKTTASSADVPLLPELAAQLLAYRDHWIQNKHGLLFATTRGNPYRADDVRTRWLLPALARAGIPPAGCHAFRHGFPLLLHDMGVSPPSISRAMRHSSLLQTERYFHHSAEAAWREIDAATGRQPDNTP